MRSDDLGTESDGSASIGSFTVNTFTGLMSRHCPKMRLPVMDTTNNESVIPVLDLSQINNGENEERKQNSSNNNHVAPERRNYKPKEELDISDAEQNGEENADEDEIRCDENLEIDELVIDKSIWEKHHSEQDFKSSAEYWTMWCKYISYIRNLNSKCNNGGYYAADPNVITDYIFCLKHGGAAVTSLWKIASGLATLIMEIRGVDIKTHKPLWSNLKRWSKQLCVFFFIYYIYIL